MKYFTTRNVALLSAILWAYGAYQDWTYFHYNWMYVGLFLMAISLAWAAIGPNNQL